MNILRLSTVALGLAAVLGLLVGWSSPASAHCKDKGPHSDPNHEGCDSEPTATFSVDVDLGNGATGTVTVTEVKMNGNRQSLNGTIASPNLDLVQVADLDCDSGTIQMLGFPDALISISTAKIPPSRTELTYVEANIYNFTAMTPTGVASFTLSFFPDSVSIPDRLFPPGPLPDNVNVNVLTGRDIGVNISPDHGSCGGTITQDQDWTITVMMD